MVNNSSHGVSSTFKRRKVASATNRLMEAYIDDYPTTHSLGIIREAIQNSIDARQNPTDFKHVSITINYDHERRILKIRDYGTTGMSHCDKCYWGIRIDNSDDCHEHECKWGNFHYLGGLAKDTHQLGIRGQGKSLAIIAGDKFIVRTKINENDTSSSMASEWSQAGDDWYWEPIPDLAMKESESIGTELIIENVKDEIHEQLLDLNSIKDDISLTWFPAIQKGVKIRFKYKGKKYVKIGPPHFKSPQIGSSGKRIIRRRKSIPITVQRKTIGYLLDLNLYFSEEPVPDNIKGIAVIKHGTQVIERISSWGRKINPELQDRLFGWVTYFCTEDMPFLQLCEKPGHGGFKTHIYYRKVNERLQEIIEDFLSPYQKELIKPKITAKDRKRAAQNLKIIQKALEDVPQFNPWSGEGFTPQPRQPKPTPIHPYISSISLDKKYYNYGEEALLCVNIQNPTVEYQPYVRLIIETLDEGMCQIESWDYLPSSLPMLNPINDVTEGKISKELSIDISDEFGIGRNWIKCELLNHNHKNSISGKNNNPDALFDRKFLALWIEEEPTKRKKAKSGGGNTGEGGKSGTLGKLQPISDGPFDPIENETMPFWAQAEIWVYTKGVRIQNVYESNPRASDSILYELIAETIANRMTRLTIEDDLRESFDKNQLIDIFGEIEQLRQQFLRACEKHRSS